jgi:hypothetical protein
MRRKKKKIWTIPGPPKEKKPKPSKALLVVDNDVILDALRKEYRKILKQAEKAEKDFQNYQQIDNVAYQEWLNSHFGEHLTQLRDYMQEGERLRSILEEVEAIAFEREINETQAFQIYKAEQEGRWAEVAHHFKPLPAEEMGKEPEEDDDDPFGDGPDDEEISEEDLMREMVEQLASMYEAETGRKPPQYEQVMQAIATKKKKPANQALKECYRSIVLRLHPDRNKDFTPYNQALWNQAQEAYQAQDLEALELILARLESGSDDVDSITKVSLVKKMIEKIKNDLHLLRQQLGQARKSPGWNFSKMSDRSVLERKIRKDLKSTVDDAQKFYLSIQAQYRELERRSNLWWEKITRPRPVAPPAAKKKKKKTQPVPDQEEFPF